MACGASSGSGAMSSLDKHPNDLFCASVHMAPLKIEEFDEFLGKFEKPANSLIKLVNTLAGALLEVKLASGALMGSLHVKYSAAVRLRAVFLFRRTSRLKRTHSLELDPLTLFGQAAS